jgi:hypothetical protein
VTVWGIYAKREGRKRRKNYYAIMDGRASVAFYSCLLLLLVCYFMRWGFLFCHKYISMAYKEHFVSPRKALNNVMSVRTNMARVNGGKPHHKKGTIFVGLAHSFFLLLFALPSFFFETH